MLQSKLFINIIINIINLFIILFRYELEYDENRTKIGHEIAKRFLGIIIEDSGGGRGGGGGGGDGGGAVDESTQNEKLDRNDKHENSINKLYSKNELVVDVLNDELTEQVQKLFSSMLIEFIILENIFFLIK